jgi:hypothetical protein
MARHAERDEVGDVVRVAADPEDLAERRGVVDVDRRRGPARDARRVPLEDLPADRGPAARLIHPAMLARVEVPDEDLSVERAAGLTEGREVPAARLDAS